MSTHTTHNTHYTQSTPHTTAADSASTHTHTHTICRGYHHASGTTAGPLFNTGAADTDKRSEEGNDGDYDDDDADAAAAAAHWRGG